MLNMISIFDIHLLSFHNETLDILFEEKNMHQSLYTETLYSV